MAGTPPAPLPSVRVLWRPQQFNRVTNPDFETNTTGWSVSASGVNKGGTSVTRITTDKHAGSASAEVVCPATYQAGVAFDLGSDRYYSEPSYGCVYIAVVWLKRMSGSKVVQLVLGSEGTSTDRATLVITDLADSWQPYTIRWLPTGSRTDAQLAIVTGAAQACTFRIDDAAVYAVDAFSQVENGTFEVDTTGWSAVNGGAISRQTSTPFGGSGYARIVSSSTIFSGADYSLGTRRFVSGRTYRVQLAARTISGSAVVNLGLGDVGASDRSTSTPTLTSSWALYTVDWTAGGDRTAVSVTVRNNAAATNTFEVDEVEVFEAADDITTDVQAMRWSRSLDAVGTWSADVLDHDARYDARNSSATLYGSLEPGRRVLVRAVYANAVYPCFFGSLTTIEPPLLGEIHASFVAEDAMADLQRERHASPFSTDWSYADIRQLVIGTVLARQPRRMIIVDDLADDPTDAQGWSRTNLTTGALESSLFYSGTDDTVAAADYLSDLNQATQSVHLVKPSVHPNIGWRYTTVDRATLTDGSSDFTIDETSPPEDLQGIRYTHEALENQQTVPWQGFEEAPAPYDAGLRLAQALDRVEYDGSSFLTEDDPYLHFTRDVYGDNGDVPEPTFRIIRRWKKRAKGRRLVKRRRRVYEDPFVPFSLAAGERKRLAVDFAVAVKKPTWSVTTAGAITIILVEASPTRIVIDVYAGADCTITGVTFSGYPYRPLEEQEVQVLGGSDERAGAYPGPTFGTPYIASAGAAEGIAAYRNWRYGSALLRPTLVDHLAFPRTLTADVTDHITLTLDRWKLSSVLFMIRASTWEVVTSGLDWRVWHDLEEIPSHSTWFTLDTSALDGTDVLAY